MKKKLSEYKDEEALDLLADLLEPVSIIMADDDFKEAMRGGNRMKAAKIALKRYKEQVFEILAVFDGVPIEEYHCNLLTAPLQLIEILSDRELMMGFTSQAQEMKQNASSGPVMENTGENEN